MQWGGYPQERAIVWYFLLLPTWMAQQLPKDDNRVEKNCCACFKREKASVVKIMWKANQRQRTVSLPLVGKANQVWSLQPGNHDTRGCNLPSCVLVGEPCSVLAICWTCTSLWDLLSATHLEKKKKKVKESKCVKPCYWVFFCWFAGLSLADVTFRRLLIQKMSTAEKGCPKFMSQKHTCCRWQMLCCGANERFFLPPSLFSLRVILCFVDVWNAAVLSLIAAR